MKNKSYDKWGFDLDGVIINFNDGFLNLLYKKHGIRLLPNEQHRFSYEETTGLPAEEVLSMVHETYSLPLQPIPGAIEFIKRYYEETKEFPVFVTSRKSTHSKPTIDWLHKYLHPVPFELVFSIKDEKGADKYLDIVRKEVDIFVEDRAKLANEIVENCDVRLLLLDYPWNRHAKKHNRILRVSDWKEINMVYERRKVDLGVKKVLPFNRNKNLYGKSILSV